MKHADLEQVYELLATRIDALGADKSELFLAKLVLLLAHENGDPDRVRQLIDAAERSL